MPRDQEIETLCEKLKMPLERIEEIEGMKKTACNASCRFYPRCGNTLPLPPFFLSNREIASSGDLPQSKLLSYRETRGEIFRHILESHYKTTDVQRLASTKATNSRQFLTNLR